MSVIIIFLRHQCICASKRGRLFRCSEKACLARLFTVLVVGPSGRCDYSGVCAPSRWMCPRTCDVMSPPNHSGTTRDRPSRVAQGRSPGRLTGT